MLLLGFSVDSIFGITYDVVLVLRSQFFHYLRETVFKHTFEHLEAARSEKKLGKNVLFLRKRLIIIDLFEGL